MLAIARVAAVIAAVFVASTGGLQGQAPESGRGYPAVDTALHAPQSGGTPERDPAPRSAGF